jgi:hypothetical protein
MRWELAVVSPGSATPFAAKLLLTHELRAALLEHPGDARVTFHSRPGARGGDGDSAVLSVGGRDFACVSYEEQKGASALYSGAPGGDALQPAGDVQRRVSLRSSVRIAHSLAVQEAGRAAQLGRVRGRAREAALRGCGGLALRKGASRGRTECSNRAAAAAAAAR